MKRIVTAAIAALLCASATSALAGSSPPPAGGMQRAMAAASPSAMGDHPDAGEAAFIAHVARTLLARYPTTVEAEKAGYLQTTGIDEDGTAIYFDFDFSHVTASHPNFLWYDRHGKLVGLDYEFPQSSYPHAPVAMFPARASRWTVVNEHMHFAYRVGNGPIVRRGARAYPNLRSEHITAAELEADHLLPARAKLVWAYHHPACWDLGFWLIPNPQGAFAEKNPNVK